MHTASVIETGCAFVDQERPETDTHEDRSDRPSEIACYASNTPTLFPQLDGATHDIDCVHQQKERHPPDDQQREALYAHMIGGNTVAAGDASFVQCDEPQDDCPQGPRDC